jgi:hypothetical protein
MSDMSDLPKPKLIRCVVPGSWSEIYRVIRNLDEDFIYETIELSDMIETEIPVLPVLPDIVARRLNIEPLD